MLVLGNSFGGGTGGSLQWQGCGEQCGGGIGAEEGCEEVELSALYCDEV